MNTDALKGLWKTVFGDPDSFIDNFFAVAFSQDRCRYIQENGEIVSALYWFDCEYTGGKLAYIYAVATHPDHRGKGLASRLLLDTHAHLKELGYAGTVLKPAKGLFPFYEHLGYTTCGYIRCFEATAGSPPVPVRRITPAEYGHLRRSYLPQNSILQEGLTLEFLHTYAEFYAGDDSIVCACPQEEIIFEYLGNPNSAAGILSALNIKAAKIPTPGNDIPFAMFCPLNCTKTPGYLGISLE